MSLEFNELKDFLEIKVQQYNRPSFVDSDPIQIPHSFTKKEDIEISAFLTAAIAWGKRSIIIQNARRMTEAMGNSPYDFVMNYSGSDKQRFQHIKHRTFNPQDLDFFIRAFKNIYSNHGGLETLFSEGFKKEQSVYGAISRFRSVFMQSDHENRSEKHVANPIKKSAAKRINMFLMWMCRHDTKGVHFGLWNCIPPSELIIPLDVHTGNTSRTLGLLHRKANDRKSAELLTTTLKQFDAKDPVKYDFALFGTGVFEQFGKIK